MEDVLIVGGGPAGLMAADYLSKLNLKITIVDQMPTMGRKFFRKVRKFVEEKFGKVERRKVRNSQKHLDE